MVVPYPDASYCSAICHSRCCRMADVDILEYNGGYLAAVLSPSQIRSLERKLEHCKGTFALVKGNPD